MPPEKNVINENRILKLLETQCQHNYNYHYNQVNHNICVQICELFKECHEKNMIFLDSTYEKFITYITQDKGYYYVKNCSTENPGELPVCVKKILTYYLPQVYSFKQLLIYDIYDFCYEALGQNKVFNNQYNKQYIECIVERLDINYRPSEYRAFNYVNNTNPEFINQFLKYIKIDEETLCVLCKCKNALVADIISTHIEKYNGKLNPICLEQACYALPYSKNLIQSLLNQGLKLNDKHLNIVCQYGNNESFEFILMNGRMPINKSHYKLLIDSSVPKSNSEKEDYYTYRSLIRKHGNSYAYKSMYTPEKMELLIKYGYTLDYDDIIYSIKNRKEIPEIERFNIHLDQKLLDLCWDYNFYPTYKFNCINAQMIELQKLCTEINLPNIRTFITKNNIIPDSKCLENASKFKHNKAVEYLIEKKGKVTLKCVKNCAATFTKSGMLTLLLNEFEKNYKEEIETYKKRIEELEANQKINKEEKEITPQNASSEKIIGSETIKPKKKNIKLPDNIIIDEESESDIPKPKKPKKIGKQKKKNLKLPDNIIIDEESEPEQLNTDLPIDDDEVMTIQKKYKTKSIPTKQMISILELDKNKKVSYSDVKKSLLSKIREESWLDETDKNLIKLPLDVKQKINIESNDVIKFNDIDKLVCVFYASLQ